MCTTARFFMVFRLYGEDMFSLELLPIDMISVSLLEKEDSNTDFEARDKKTYKSYFQNSS
jgi:hypothetical protein